MTYQVFGSGGAHFGAATIINIAPMSMDAHKSQKQMKRNQRRRTQKGSFAYFINSSFPIPTTTEGFKSAKID